MTPPAYTYGLQPLTRSVMLVAMLYCASDRTHGQIYGSTMIDPFDLTAVGLRSYSSIVFADIDGDGDLDLVNCPITVNTNDEDVIHFSWQENVGTPNVPEFSAPVLNPAGVFNSFTYFEPYSRSSRFDLKDIDNDGDLDLLLVLNRESGTNTSINELVLFRNAGSSTEPVLTTPPEIDPFGIELPFNHIDLDPKFADMDMDGDLDLLLSGRNYDWFNDIYDREFYYYENTGTAESAQFTVRTDDPFGLELDYVSDISLSLVDANNDSAIDVVIHYTFYDLIGGAVIGRFRVYENSGAPGTPAFNAPVTDPLGLDPQGPAPNILGSAATFADIDADGDMDAFVLVSMDLGSGASNIIRFQENNGSIGAGIGALDAAPSVHCYPNPVSDILQVQSSSWSAKDLLLYDCSGRLVVEATIIDQAALSVAQLEPGAYHLIVRTRAGSGSTPIPVIVAR